jgi:hypothetical protein
MKVKCETILPTIMKTLMTVDVLRKMNHYSHQMYRGLRISLIKKLGASMMVRCCNMCTMLIKCCGMLSFNECTHLLN